MVEINRDCNCPFLHRIIYRANFPTIIAICTWQRSEIKEILAKSQNDDFSPLEALPISAMSQTHSITASYLPNSKNIVFAQLIQISIIR